MFAEMSGLLLLQTYFGGEIAQYVVGSVAMLKCPKPNGSILENYERKKNRNKQISLGIKCLG